MRWILFPMPPPTSIAGDGLPNSRGILGPPADCRRKRGAMQLEGSLRGIEATRRAEAQVLVRRYANSTWEKAEGIYRRWLAFTGQSEFDHTRADEQAIVGFHLHYFSDHNVSSWSSVSACLCIALWNHHVLAEHRWSDSLQARLSDLRIAAQREWGVPVQKRPPVQERHLQALYYQARRGGWDVVRVREWTLVLVGTLCTLRASELQRLRYKDIVWTFNPPRISLKETKTGHRKAVGGEETIHLLSFPARPWLNTAQAIHLYWQQMRWLGASPEDPLFKWPGKTWNGTWLQRLIRKAITSVETEEDRQKQLDWSGHSLRSGGMMLLLGLRFPLVAVQRQGRWADARTLEVYYRGLDAIGKLWIDHSTLLGLNVPQR